MTTPTPNLRAACTAGAAAHRLHQGVERGSDDLVVCAECGWSAHDDPAIAPLDRFPSARKLRRGDDLTEIEP